MAGRPQKQTVDYFPHDAVSGKTLFILQSRFGNNGYAVWFKTLALLCRSSGQVYDCNSPADWQYLLAEMALSGGEITEVYNTLAELQAIDRDLWAVKIIWCQNLVDRLAPIFRERKTNSPIKPPINAIIPPINAISPPEIIPPPNGEPVSHYIPPPELNKSKVKESKVNNVPPIIPPPPAAAILSPDKKTSRTRATTEAEFLEYVTETKKEFPDLDCEVEFKRFRLYWSEGGRKLKRPKTAWFNWLVKAREIKQGGNGAKTQRTTQNAIPQDRKYESPAEFRARTGGNGTAPGRLAA